MFWSWPAQTASKMGAEDYVLGHIIGEGSFGKVMLQTGNHRHRHTVDALMC